MFRGNKKYYYILGVLFIAVITLQYSQPKPINWKKTYFKNDKISFGCYAIFNLLEKNYTQKLDVNSQTFYSLNTQKNESNQTIILVNDQLEFSKLDLKSFFDFLKRGNTVLLSANEFGKLISDTFKLQTTYNWNDNYKNLDSLLKKPAFEIKYIQPKNNVYKTYNYPQIASESYFKAFDTTLFKVSSINKNNMPVLLEASIGEGKLLISSVPDIFGNIFIVNHKNRFYTYTLLSKIKNKKIIWDEYYKTYNIQKEGLFQFIFNNDTLYMAYSILLLGLIFFMLFEMKRKQRAIPVITPLQNSTLEFVDVISHVYFNSNNHKHIAEETLNYFYFEIRRKFHVNTHTINQDFYTTIHKLSGIALEDVKKLFIYCENLNKATSLTEYDLLELNDRINNFKQKSIR